MKALGLFFICGVLSIFFLDNESKLNSTTFLFYFFYTCIIESIVEFGRTFMNLEDLRSASVFILSIKFLLSSILVLAVGMECSLCCMESIKLISLVLFFLFSLLSYSNSVCVVIKGL